MRRINRRTPEEVTSFCKELFGRSTGFATVKAKQNQKGAVIDATVLSDHDGCIYAVDNYKMEGRTRKVTYNTFYSKQDTKRESLSCIGAIAVRISDLDGSQTMQSSKPIFENLLFKLEESGNEGLTPTFAICADYLYLVYVLEKAFYVGRCKGKKKENALKFLEHIQEGICETLGDLVYGIRIAPVKLNGSLPMPGYKHCIYEMVFNESGDPKWRIQNFVFSFVAAPENSRRYDVNVLADACMERLPADWRNKGRKRYKISLRPKKPFHITDILLGRLQLLEALQKKNDYQGDEAAFMTFLYRNFSEQILGSQEDAEKFARKFYNKFSCRTDPKPLNKGLYRVINPDTGEAKSYKYRNETLFEKLGITRELADSLGYHTSDKKAYDREYSKRRRELARKEAVRKGNTCRQKIMKAAKKAMELVKNGLSKKEICRKLNISKSTLLRYLSSGNSAAPVTA